MLNRVILKIWCIAVDIMCSYCFTYRADDLNYLCDTCLESILIQHYRKVLFKQPLKLNNDNNIKDFVSYSITG